MMVPSTSNSSSGCCRHGLKATSKALAKELVSAGSGLSATEEEIVEKHSLDTILSTWQADADDEDEAAHAKPRAHTKNAATATAPAPALAANGLKRKAADLSTDSADEPADSSAASANSGAKEQHMPKDDDSAIVSSSSGTVVGTTKPAAKRAALPKKHEGARPTPLAALSASATPGSHISNAYQSYDYADRAYKDLSVTRGKGFTKEKNKKKRGSYRGGPIDISGGKSFKFDD
ncbi:hypothetical protein DV737_g5328, partial [Chaetothyriales sp. CBS 132003]